MSTLSYPARFTKERDAYDVSFADFPEAHTFGIGRADAFRMAIDCLQAAIEYRREEKAAIPAPSTRKRGQIAVPVRPDA
jgi:antitoxin HicB